MIHIPEYYQFNTQVVGYLVLGSFVLGYLLGWLGRPERESVRESDEFVTDETLNHIMRAEAKKGYRP